MHARIPHESLRAAAQRENVISRGKRTLHQLTSAARRTPRRARPTARAHGGDAPSHKKKRSRRARSPTDSRGTRARAMASRAAEEPPQDAPIPAPDAPAKAAEPPRAAWHQNVAATPARGSCAGQQTELKTQQHHRTALKDTATPQVRRRRRLRRRLVLRRHPERHAPRDRRAGRRRRRAVGLDGAPAERHRNAPALLRPSRCQRWKNYGYDLRRCQRWKNYCYDLRDANAAKIIATTFEITLQKLSKTD